jgi:RNA polymerase sigma-70 factor (ECF subfamily)
LGILAQQLGQEEALIRRIQSGDDAAFDRLVELCSGRVYSLAFRMMGNADDAQDVAQEVFVRVYQAIPRFRCDATFSTWLYRIVVNACHDEAARRKRRPQTMSDAAPDDESPDMLDTLVADGEPEDLYLRHERQQALQQALLELPENFRAVVILHDVQGLSYDEMAEVLHTGLGTIKSRLNRARNMLREKIYAHTELFGRKASQTQ